MKINTMFYATIMVCLFPWHVYSMLRASRQIPACLRSFNCTPRPSQAEVAQSNSINDLTFPLNQKGDTILHLAIRRDNFNATEYWFEVYRQADIDVLTITNNQGETPLDIHRQRIDELEEEVGAFHADVENPLPDELNQCIFNQGRIWCLFCQFEMQDVSFELY